LVILDGLQKKLPVPLDNLFFRQMLPPWRTVSEVPPYIVVVFVLWESARGKVSFYNILTQKFPFLSEVGDCPGGAICFRPFRNEKAPHSPVRPDRGSVDSSAQVLPVFRKVVDPATCWTIVELQQRPDHRQLPRVI